MVPGWSATCYLGLSRVGIRLEVRLGPAGELQQRRLERAAALGETVDGRQRGTREDLPLHDACVLQLLEPRREHPFCDARDAPGDLGEPRWALTQRADDHAGPPLPEQPEDAAQRLVEEAQLSALLRGHGTNSNAWAVEDVVATKIVVTCPSARDEGRTPRSDAAGINELVGRILFGGDFVYTRGPCDSPCPPSPGGPPAFRCWLEPERTGRTKGVGSWNRR